MMLQKPTLVALIMVGVSLMESVWMKQPTTHFHILDSLCSKVKNLQKKYLHAYMDLEKIEFLSKKSTQAFLSTAIISLIPFVLLVFIPTKSCHSSSKFMRFLLGFAVGSLLGDSLLHLIPHSMESINDNVHDNVHHDKTHHENMGEKFIKVTYPLLGGLLTFYIIESLIRIFKHRMNQAAIGAQKKKDSEPVLPNEPKVVGSFKKNKMSKSKLSSIDNTDNIASETIKKKRSKTKSRGFSNSAMSTAAFLNLMTDFSHNLLDGMAICAAYQHSFKLGLATTFGVLIHEIPHEISDFAILIKAGYSKWKAAFIQLLTAIGAMIGVYLGLYLSQHGVNNQSPQWLLSFVAGGFIYISCVCVTPEMLNEPNPRILTLMLEVVGMICGVSLMEIFTNVHVH